MTNLKKVKKLKLTWELLKKEESELTPAEKILVDEHHQHVEKLADELDKANAELRENCKIVTSGPETELIPAYGWIHPVKDMAYAIEALNIMYRKYRLYVNFDQCKEKYADFRGYFSIYTLDSKPFRILTWPFTTLRDLFHKKIKYEERVSIEVPSHNELVWRVRETDDDCECQEDPPSQHPTVTLNDGERKLTLTCRRSVRRDKCKVKPTKHRLLWLLRDPVAKLCKFIEDKLEFLNAETPTMTVMRQRFDTQVKELVAKCEADCRKRCIICGSWIDNDNGYCTRGWYTYICRRCAGLVRGGVESCDSFAENKAIKGQLRLENSLKIALKHAEEGLDDSIQLALETMRKNLGNDTKIKKTVKSTPGYMLDSSYEDDGDDFCEDGEGFLRKQSL